MSTWTVKDLKGVWLGADAVVTAEDVQMACLLLEKALAEAGIPQTVTHEQLVPVVTTTRWVRILDNGDY